jgi:hypothetical protein
MKKMIALVSGLTLALAGAAGAESVFRAVPGSGGPTQAPSGSPEDFVLDDGTNENNIGLNNTASGTATQFMWFNRFDVDPSLLPIRIDQVRIFWDPTPTGAATVGNAVSLEIYSDNDANPANGATHAYTENDTIAQVGTSFDVYALTTPPELATAVNLLVGVVDRWITTGVSTTAFPAAIDQTTPNNGRSFVASYAAGSPPVPPTIPSDGLFGTIDSFGLAGDWLIRATGSLVPVELQTFSIE